MHSFYTQSRVGAVQRRLLWLYTRVRQESVNKIHQQRAYRVNATSSSRRRVWAFCYIAYISAFNMHESQRVLWRWWGLREESLRRYIMYIIYPYNNHATFECEVEWRERERGRNWRTPRDPSFRGGTALESLLKQRCETSLSLSLWRYIPARD